MIAIPDYIAASGVDPAATLTAVTATARWSGIFARTTGRPCFSPGRYARTVRCPATVGSRPSRESVPADADDSWRLAASRRGDRT